MKLDKRRMTSDYRRWDVLELACGLRLLDPEFECRVQRDFFGSPSLLFDGTISISRCRLHVVGALRRGI